MDQQDPIIDPTQPVMNEPPVVDSIQPAVENEITEVSEKYVLAALSYMAVLVFIPFFMERQDAFVNFHIRQGFILLGAIIVSLVITSFVPLLGNLFFLLLLIASIIGFVQTIRGRRWRIPGIANLADKIRI